MNEELKIVIKAVTDNAKKGIQDVNKQLNGMGKVGEKAGKAVIASFSTIGIAAAAAVAAVAPVVMAVIAVGAALVTLGKNTLQFNKTQAKLFTAFEAAGMSAKQAKETYEDFYRFLGDQDRAVEAANHLTKITNGQKELAEWAKISQGVYATFGDSLPIEGLTEAANESLRVGKITGVLADALTWAGYSEEQMNQQLAATNSLEEREILLRETLNGLYTDAANIYEKNNQALLNYNESQARLDITMGAAGAAVLPLMTALNNLGAAFFTALKPALDVIIPAMATFVNWITQGIQAVTSFFSALTGKSTAVKAISSVGQSAKAATSGLKNATDGAGGLSKGLEGTAKAAAEAKKSTQGFDELNIVAGDKASGGGGGGGSSAPAYAGGSGAPGYAGMLDGATFGAEVEETGGKANRFVEDIKSAFATLKDVFAPTIEAWSGAWQTITAAWETAKPNFIKGAAEIGEGVGALFTYYFTDYAPSIINSFSTNLAPYFGDVIGFAIKEIGKTFEWFGGLFKDVCTNIIIPYLDLWKMVITDVFDIIGNLWADKGAPLIEKAGAAYEQLRQIITNIYEVVVKPIFNKLKDAVTKFWNNHLKPTVESIVEALFEIGETCLDIFNEFILPVINWIVQNIFPIVVNIVSKIIDEVASVYAAIAKIIQGIMQVIKGIAQFIGGVFTGDWSRAWEGIKNIFAGVWEAIKGVALYAWEYIKGVFGVAGAFFAGVWEAIKAVFAGVASWFGSIFTSAWNGIKNAFSAVKSFFTGVWNDIKNIFSKVGTAIADGIKGAVTSAINGVLSKAVNTINGFISAINSAISLINEIPGVNIKKLSKLSVPKLAEGGVVDKATLAMIGEAGKEAVVPLENTEWIDKLAAKITAQQPQKVVLQIGETVLGWATINAINGITEQTGGLQLKI